MHPDLTEMILTAEQLHARIAQLGAALSGEFRGQNPVFVCVLKGAVHFFSDLMLQIRIPCEYDFVACSSYGEAIQSGGAIELTKDTSLDLQNRPVVLVDDIIDSGLTLSYLRSLLQTRNPACVKLCVLMDKPERRSVKISADYVGFTIPNVFVVGYGLDYAQAYRNLPYIGILKPEVYRG